MNHLKDPATHTHTPHTDTYTCHTVRLFTSGLSQLDGSTKGSRGFSFQEGTRGERIL